MDMYETLRPLLFRLDAETAHHLTLGLLKWAGDLPGTRDVLRALFDFQDERLHVNVFGREFKNRVGLAAGYDKNAVAINGLAALGFGHLEVGTVTRLPQAGNAKPRVWRVPEARALINCMGFPNAGVAQLHFPKSGAQRAVNTRIGINIGKGKETPLENAVDDYIALLQKVHAHADYIAINISSPNTPGLRALQARDAVEPLLKQIADAREALSSRVPVLVKIAPDLSCMEIDGIVDAARDVNFDGIIATNTTVCREGVPEYARRWGGGLSGAPLRARSTAIIRHIYETTRGEFPIIGVGGVGDAASALEKLRAGATLIQIFTGLIYRGPRLVREINEALLRGADNASNF
jgi:dihydroorotate dehydrogenase